MRTHTLAIGLFCTGIALAGCSGGSDGKGADKASGSETPTGKGSTAPAGVPEMPAGYRKVGGQKNGFTAGVPKSWKAMDFTSDPRARAEFRKAGFSAAVAEQTIKTMKQNHAVFVFDPRSAKTQHFATNLNGFCMAGAMPSADQVKEQFQTIGARNIKTTDVTVGGQDGQKSSYELRIGTSRQIAVQYRVAGTTGKICFVTITAKKGMKPPFDTIAGTIHAL
jgi:hypothetical protein